MGQSTRELLAATLSELGLAVPTDFVQTMLMSDNYFGVWKFRYDGGYAILQAGGETIEFCDEEGELLKSVALKAEQKAAA